MGVFKQRYRAELGLWTSALKLLSRPVVLRLRCLFPFQLPLIEIIRGSTYLNIHSNKSL